jgi:hypothetical protein
MRNGYVCYDSGTLYKIFDYMFKPLWYSMYISRSDYNMQADIFVHKLKKYILIQQKCYFFKLLIFFQALDFIKSLSCHTKRSE